MQLSGGSDMFMMKPDATLIDRLAFEKAFLVVCILGSNSLGAEPEGSPLTLAKALALTLEKSPALSSFPGTSVQPKLVLFKQSSFQTPRSVWEARFYEGRCEIGH
jgi:hypothetical protein